MDSVDSQWWTIPAGTRPELRVAVEHLNSSLGADFEDLSLIGNFDRPLSVAFTRGAGAFHKVSFP